MASPLVSHRFFLTLRNLVYIYISTFFIAPIARTQTLYNGPAPNLPSRKPFGFGSAATGGGEPSPNNTYLVDNMVDLRAVLEMTTPRAAYVQGKIHGNEIDKNTSANCQWYIDHSNAKNFNFTRYVQSLNSTYTDWVKGVAAQNGTIDGMPATELAKLLGRQNGWRNTVQNVQKSYESIDAQGNLTLIGMDSDAFLSGVSLVFNSRSNVIIRNLRMAPPRDCFPAPETYPGSWNARYDAISFVDTQTAWLDGNILADGLSPVAPDNFIWGWEVDHYDGLFDAEDGTDNVTFSHNIVANHHKSLMWGGGEKEGPRDLGKMRFTVFGNRFSESESRNPLMRFGTFYIVNNVFESRAENPPRYAPGVNVTLSEKRGKRQETETYNPPFEYHMGIYNMSSVLVSGNYFTQTGMYANDTTRIFTFSNLMTPNQPATLCSPPDLSVEDLGTPGLKDLSVSKSVFNGRVIDLAENVKSTFAWFIAEKTSAVEDGLAVNCSSEKFKPQSMPRTFESAEDVRNYVSENAGQLGRSEP